MGICREGIEFVASLKECATKKDLKNGIRLHGSIVQKGLLAKNPYVGTSLINMYIKCGSISKAQQLFDELPHRNVASWNALISGYVRDGQPKEALRCFGRIRSDGLSPNAVTYTAALMACGRARFLIKGKEIHDEIWKNGLLGTRCTIIDDDDDGDDGDEGKEWKNGLLGTWCTIIDDDDGDDDEGKEWKNGLLGTRCTIIVDDDDDDDGEGKEWHAVTENKETKAAFAVKELLGPRRGHCREAHSKVKALMHTKASENEVSVSLGNALVDMYAKCGALETAQHVLGALPVANVVSWSALMMGYNDRGRCAEAIDCFEQMRREGHCPDAIAFASLLRACGRIGAIDKGEEIHDEILNNGLLGRDMYLGNALVDMYAKCGALKKALQAFNGLLVRDIASWTTLISGYAAQGEGIEAMRLFERMRYEGCSPNEVTFISALKACGSIGAVEKGREIHEEIAASGLLGRDIGLGNALLDMYAKCGALDRAKQMLDELRIRDGISWSCLIAGYANRGQGEEALKCFEQMQQEGLSPDKVAFICALKACTSIRAVGKGELIHIDIIAKGLLAGKDIALGNALVAMYAKCGSLAKARRQLDELLQRDVVSYNALLAGYAVEGRGAEAMEFLRHMEIEGISPDAITFTCMLKACGGEGEVGKGEEIHDEIVSRGFLADNVALGNALVDMYARCGVLTQAQQTFDALRIRDAVTWATIISGYAQHGQGEQALVCFRLSLFHGIFPNPTIFVSVLSACSHSGLLGEAQMYYEKMSEFYGVIPHVEHHSCMIDLFGRVGHFDEAVSVILRMPSSDHVPVWDSLLGACRKWGNVKLGRLAFEHLARLKRNNEAAYICMIRIYMAAGMLEEAAKIEAMRAKKKAREMVISKSRIPA